MAEPEKIARSGEKDSANRPVWDESKYPQGCRYCDYWQARDIEGGVCRDCGKPFKG
jgi:hypothetical protein